MEINLPNNWDEVYLDQFIALKMIDPDLNYYDRQLNILAILTDKLTDDECWDDLDINDLSESFKSLKWLSTEPTNYRLLSYGNYRSVDISTFSFGEFLDMEHFMVDWYNNLPHISAIFWRLHKEDSWGNIKLQEYGSYDAKERAESFMEAPITHFYWLLKYYLDWKDSTLSAYENLFEPIITDEDEDYEPDEDDLEQEKLESVNNKWGWEQVLHQFSNGDITKYDELTKLPLIFILNQMSFRREMKI